MSFKRIAYTSISWIPLITIFIVACLSPVTSYAQGKAYLVEEGIVFKKVGDIELQLDLARPARGQGPFPAIIFIFGGAWGYYETNRRTEFYIDIREAAKRGYVAVTIDYRLTNIKENGKSKYQFPAQVHDAKCAVRWLRVNAERYSIDPNHIGAVGFSSGAHLALMLGLTDANDGLESDCYDVALSSRVQCVVSIAGPSELASLYSESYDPKDIFLDFLGGSPKEVPQAYKSASPISYVTSDDPPILIIHNDGDYEVPLKQALLLEEKLSQVGVSHRLTVKKGLHTDYVIDEEIWNFFSSNLKRE
jgi:acetyl esterase/lipase